MKTTPNTPVKGFVHWLRHSNTARMLMIGFLILVLLIPLAYVSDLIRERKHRQADVVREIGQSWGEEVLLMGPILKVPYLKHKETNHYDPDTKKTTVKTSSWTAYAYFLPDDLQLDAQIDGISKRRGIYESSVFSSRIKMNGAFGRPDFVQHDVQEKDILWDKATVILRSTNLKGIKNTLALQLGATSLSFLPRYVDDQQRFVGGYPAMHTLESSVIDVDDLLEGGDATFRTELNVNGSKRIQFIPIGAQTHVHMSSNWPHPSHVGEFLPEEDDMKYTGPDGFKANWNVLLANRPFGQSFLDKMPNLTEFAFGTALYVPVDGYQKSERSAKYGYLVIALTFLIFFLIQAGSGISIHPFQYLMIGLALVMFYTLLISISEHQNYTKAYVIASVAVVSLISLYTRSILSNPKMMMLVGSSLTALYAFIFVIIQMENYALLIGSIGLFLILAAVMFASRRINWSAG